MYTLYPIRMNRSFWKIPLFSIHHCSDSCYPCNKGGLLHKTNIHLNSYHISNPCGEFGYLYNPDTVVIPDLDYTIRLSFPIESPVNISIGNSHPTTIRELLFTIKQLYQTIYNEEYNTASPREFSIVKQCEHCKDHSFSDYMTSISCSENNKNEPCSICYNSYSEHNLCQLQCKHIFHTECIEQWINAKQTGQSCPLCRCPIQNCLNCKGTLFETQTYTGIVLPLEYRTGFRLRNTTNGIYGIYDYDFEHLIIDELVYNRDHKTLHVIMCVF